MTTDPVAIIARSVAQPGNGSRDTGKEVAYVALTSGYARAATTHQTEHGRR
jgi:hypothetical protein